MGKLIQDQFTSMKGISRQRRYQLRREADGLCRLCGEQSATGSAYCRVHLENQRRLCRKVKTDTPKPDARDLI